MKPALLPLQVKELAATVVTPFPFAMEMAVTMIIQCRFWCCNLLVLIHVGGDQLTSARVRGSQKVCSYNDRGVDRVEGLQAVTEDWHAKGILLTVSPQN